MIIGFIGMSHLGICHAITTAKKGYNVIGYDENYENIKNLKKGNISFYEPKLNEILKKNKKKITFTNNFSEVKNCDLVFFSKDIPTNKKNQSVYKDINK